MINTTKKQSVNLLPDAVWIKLIELNFFYYYCYLAGWKHSFCRICAVTFWSPLRPVVKNWYPTVKTRKKLSVKIRFYPIGLKGVQNVLLLILQKECFQSAESKEKFTSVR